MRTKDQLTEQIRLVLKRLEKEFENELDTGLIEIIYRRYLNALDILEKNKDIKNINIEGSVRAYLDAYSDFENPILGNMHNAENLARNLMSLFNPI